MGPHINGEKEGFYRGDSLKKSIDIGTVFPPEYVLKKPFS
jgi:hypothetical protein